MTKLGGWQRLGFILSLAWALFVLGTCAIQYASDDFEVHFSGACPTLSEEWFIYWQDSKSGKRLHIYLDGERSIYCGEAKTRAKALIDATQKGLIEPVKKIAYPQLLASIVLPILAIWLVPYGAVRVVRWVLAGFKESKNANV